MAFRCDYCQKKNAYGHAVSHAKNRVNRIFKINLQKLKLLKNGVSVRVKFCTRCIKRLKKDGKLGTYRLFSRTLPEVAVSMPKIPADIAKTTEKVKKEKAKEKARETIKIDEIVGKKK